MAQVIQFSATPNYTGRVVALSPDRAQKYQCGGFFLGPKRPAAIVPPDAQHSQIHQAILDGRLIEVSRDAIKTQNATLNTVKDLGETGLETFLIVREIDGVKMVSFITPNNKEQEAVIRKCIEEKRPIDFSQFPELEAKKEVTPYLSRIIITDMPEETK